MFKRWKMDEQKLYAVIEITLENRSDGGLRVFSDDLPGLVLSSNDRDAVLADIIPAIKILLEPRLGADMTVVPDAGLRALLEPSNVVDLPSPEQTERQRYIVGRKLAA